MDTRKVRTILTATSTLEEQIAVKEERLLAAEASKRRLAAVPSPTPRSPSMAPHWMEPLIASVEALRTEIAADKAALPVAQQQVCATID